MIACKIISGQVEESEKADHDDEATEFNASTPIRHFETIFYDIFNVNIYGWLAGLIGETILQTSL